MADTENLDDLRAQWHAVATEPLDGIPPEALIASVRQLARELLARTKGPEGHVRDAELAEYREEIARLKARLGRVHELCRDVDAQAFATTQPTPAWVAIVRQALG